MNPYPTAAELDEIGASAERCCIAAASLPAAEAGARLAQDGLIGLLAPEPFGLGLHPGFARPVIEAAARNRLAYPLAETLAASLVLPRLDEGVAAAVLEGREGIAVTGLSSVRARSSGVGSELDGMAGDVLGIETARWLLLPVRDESGEGLALVDREAAGVTVEPLAGLDIERPRARLRLSGVVIPDAHFVSEAAITADFLGRLALLRAIDAYGAAQGTLDLAIAHLSARSQFGRTLIGFQALRHELARARMALESGARLVEQALAAGQGDVVRTADLAYAHAAAITPEIAEMALQMHGGMGFTWDVPVHRHLRRVKAMFAVDGVAAARERVADRALADALAPLPD